MAVANPIELSGYIVSMAVSARAAQAIMSAGTDPMTIDKFEFKVNISADFSVQSETDIGLNIWVLSIKEKLTIDYKSHWGLEIDCIMNTPTKTIAGTAPTQLERSPSYRVYTHRLEDGRRFLSSANLRPGS